MVSVWPLWWQVVGSPRNKIWTLVALVCPNRSQVIATSSVLVKSEVSNMEEPAYDWALNNTQLLHFQEEMVSRNCHAKVWRPKEHNAIIDIVCVSIWTSELLWQFHVECNMLLWNGHKEIQSTINSVLNHWSVTSQPFVPLVVNAGSHLQLMFIRTTRARFKSVMENFNIHLIAAHQDSSVIDNFQKLFDKINKKPRMP